MNDEYFRAKTRAELAKRYGNIHLDPRSGKLVWPDAGKWVKPCYLPDEISAVLKNGITGRKVDAIHCNIEVHKPLLEVMDLLVAEDCHRELETFDGSFNIRHVRAYPDTVSLHSWAIAFDFNAAKNKLGTHGKWSAKFVSCWEKVGFRYGGNFVGRKDPMHFEWFMPETALVS